MNGTVQVVKRYNSKQQLGSLQPISANFDTVLLLKNMEIVLLPEWWVLILLGQGPWMFCEMLVHMSIWPISALGVSHLGTHHPIIINFPDYKQWVFISVNPAGCGSTQLPSWAFQVHTHIKHTHPNHKWAKLHLNHSMFSNHYSWEILGFHFSGFPTLNPHAYTNLATSFLTLLAI